MDEIIYILKNEAMPDLCKIGFTHRLKERMSELSKQTGVPLPFDLFYAKKVQISAREIERWLHELFEKDRVNPNREFFTTSPEKVKLAMRYIEGEEVALKENVIAETEVELKAQREFAKRKDRFNFKLANIPMGAVLTLADDESITCTVASEINKVNYIGEILSISDAAQKARKKEYAHRGPLYWMYQGETLDERRRRIEESHLIGVDN